MSLMVIYQFVFFACYDLFERVSMDSLSFVKTISFITALDFWIIATIFLQLKLHYHALQVPSYSVAVALSTSLSISSYYVFGYKDRWEEYAREFRRYSKKQLLIGRVAVFLAFPLAFVALLVSIHQAQQQNLL